MTQKAPVFKKIIQDYLHRVTRIETREKVAASLGVTIARDGYRVPFFQEMYTVAGDIVYDCRRQKRQPCSSGHSLPISASLSRDAVGRHQSGNVQGFSGRGALCGRVPQYRGATHCQRLRPRSASFAATQC